MEDGRWKTDINVVSDFQFVPSAVAHEVAIPNLWVAMDVLPFFSGYNGTHYGLHDVCM